MPKTLFVEPVSLPTPGHNQQCRHVKVDGRGKVLWVLVKLDQGRDGGVVVLRPKYRNTAAISTNADDSSLEESVPAPPIYDCNGRDYAFPTIAACPNYKGARLFAAEEWLPNADIVAALVPGWLLCAAAGFAHAVLGVRCIATQAKVGGRGIGVKNRRKVYRKLKRKKESALRSLLYPQIATRHAFPSRTTTRKRTNEPPPSQSFLLL